MERKLNSNLPILTILFFYLFSFTFEYIIIPFHYLKAKTKSYDFDNISGKDFLEFSTNKLVSSISVGSPQKELEFYITMDYNLFFIGKGYCEQDTKSLYKPESSNTFKNSTFYSYPFDDLRNMTIGNDSCTVYNEYNLGKNISLNILHLLYGSKINLLKDIIYEDKVCGIMGMKYHEVSDSYYAKFRSYSLFNSLKDNNISNYSDWTIDFFDDKDKKKYKGYDGYLVLGAGDNDYIEKIKKKNQEKIQYTYISSATNVLEWMIPFNHIYYFYPKGNKTLLDNMFNKIEINVDLDYYFSTKEYFDNMKNGFFKTYLESGKCKVIKLKEFYLRYQYIYCDHTFESEISKFPTLSFENVGLEYTFNITYKDAFKEVGDKILFLFFYDPWSPDVFKAGKNFMKKFQFIFRYSAKRIGFLTYDVNNKGNEGSDSREERERKKRNFEIKQLIWIFILLVLLIGIIIGLLFGKKIWDKNRRKRANELVDDDYDYNSGITGDGKEKDNNDNNIN